MKLPWFRYASSSSSSWCAACTDFLDPLNLDDITANLVPIVHCSRFDFHATSCISTELLYIDSSLPPYSCSPQETRIGIYHFPWLLLIPTKIKTKYRVPWETLAVREKRALVKTASKNYRKNPTNTNALKLKTAQYQLAGIYIKEQTEYIQNQIDKIRDSVEDIQSRIAWQTINEVSRRKNTAKAKLKAANQQERIKLWKQHFENLLGNPPKITHEPITRIISKQLDIKLRPFTQEELDFGSQKN